MPDTDELRSESLTNLGTFAGAICFLLAAALLLPRQTGARAATT